jgi:PIN domain nuclease of toxin-antitoxin system
VFSVRLLLDTHVLLWWLGDSRRLPAAWRRAIADADTQVLVSAATIWEIAIKRGLGKVRIDLPAEVSLAGLPRACGFEDLVVKAEHAAAVQDLPPHHADPFDRLLIAQARYEGLTFVTADQAASRYDVARLPA